MAARGFVRPEQMVTLEGSLEEAGSTFEALNRGEIVGRAVVVM